jgi:hypothetical protein
MKKDALFVGLDTDKKHIDVAVAEPLPGGEVRYWRRTANTPASIDRLIKKLGLAGHELVVCYEAGPCRYGLYRQLAGKRVNPSSSANRERTTSIHSRRCIGLGTGRRSGEPSLSSQSGLCPYSRSVRASRATNLGQVVANPRVRDRSTGAAKPASRPMQPRQSSQTAPLLRRTEEKLVPFLNHRT